MSIPASEEPLTQVEEHYATANEVVAGGGARNPYGTSGSGEDDS